MSFGITDLETENRPYYGHKASPHNPDNYIVAAAYAIDTGTVIAQYYHNKEEAAQKIKQFYAAFFENITVMVAHNATFEIHWFMQHCRDEFLGFLKRGGYVFCTQYAEYLLTHQQTQYATLEECSLKYGGSKKIDEVKLLWEQGFYTSQIDEELLMRYLAGSEGDIENTRTVCYTQYQLLASQGMLEMFWMRMDSLVFNAISTYNGLYVDMDVAKRNHAAQLQEADDLLRELEGYLPEDLPKELEFNWGSDYHLSAFLFGGAIKYQHKVSYDPIKYEKVEAYQLNDWWDTDMYPYIPKDKFYKDADGTYIDKVFYDTELHGDATDIVLYKAGKNKGQPKVFSVGSNTEKLKWGDTCYHFAGVLGIHTLPPHVQELYIGRRAEFKGKRELVDGTPVYSTSGDSLAILAQFSPIAKPLKRYNDLAKDNGTYYITHTYDKDGQVKGTKGMLQFVRPDGIINHSLNGTSTVTTRLSSSNPNLQNLPRKGTSKVKEMFASRFGDGGRIVEVDYTALEVVTLATISNDMHLLEKLLSGTDMHSYRLAAKLGMSYEDVLLRIKDKDHPEHTKFSEMRTDIKAPSFAAQYGASAAGISFATGVSLEYATEFLATEAKLFPESFSYKYLVLEEVERTGAEAPLCREMTDSGFMMTYRRGHFKAKGGTCYSFRQYQQWDKESKSEVMKYKETQIANYWCQGEASFIVQAACGLVMRWLVANDFFGGNVLCINTVHDAIYLDCVNEEWARFAGKAVAAIMADTPKQMCARMPAYKEWRYDTTPFPAAAEFGVDMAHKEDC